MYQGSTKRVLKHLNFLHEEFGFNFKFQSFEDYKGFSGPVDTYSFYNQHGCFTLHNIVQCNEWRWFISQKFSNDQYDLLQQEINPSMYISTDCWLYSTILKRLAASAKVQIRTTGCLFGIKVF